MTSYQTEKLLIILCRSAATLFASLHNGPLLFYMWWVSTKRPSEICRQYYSSRSTCTSGQADLRTPLSADKSTRLFNITVDGEASRSDWSYTVTLRVSAYVRILFFCMTCYILDSLLLWTLSYRLDVRWAKMVLMPYAYSVAPSAQSDLRDILSANW